MTAVTTAPGNPLFSNDQITVRPPLDERSPMRTSFTAQPLTNAAMGLGTRRMLNVNAGSAELREPLIEPATRPDGHGIRELRLTRLLVPGEVLPEFTSGQASVGSA